MHPLLKKLNYKNQPEIWVIKAPAEFEAVMKEMAEEVTIIEDVISGNKIHFALVFAYEQADVAPFVDELLPQLEEDAVIWFAYPKKSSKRYSSDLSRDNGWQPLGNSGFEGVRQIAINEDWSALRFRHIDYIKTLTRNKKLAMSEQGKKREI
ncbi:DUF3052 domain-containing protein [Pseudalkalibacillus salsuginis]|uniref:DUF3052 domain-containing protein n=1 Tax=Pseudalkalibacillus salsuginis TaxID=2910972 RepID=UPI001F34C6DE|nr:DUF3052 domain-containing protein [Pseudalkalibacillus salsuginis]MCF6410361.1 DUF3052 domain-containing protein [Pseudalkalibacillus salsuginis]